MLTPQPQSLAAWLQYLEQLHPAGIALGLERVRPVAEALGVTRLPGKVVMVAGTNGKGSVCALLAQMARNAGVTVGVYTSPHLQQFNERVVINGVMASDAQLCAAFAAVEAARGQVALTYFEFTTLAAFYLLAQSNLALLILEVGLGGRLDVVNITEPDVTVITRIDYDHCDWLGESLGQIAREKCGILRPGVPLVCGTQQASEVVAQQARSVGCPYYQLGREFSYQDLGEQWQWQLPEGRWLSAAPQLLAQNVAVSLMVAWLLRQWFSLPDAALMQAVGQAQVAGRQQWLPQQRMLLDVAHNPDAARALAQGLAKYPVQGWLAVVAMLEDKDHAGVLMPLADQVIQWFAADLAVPRGAKAETWCGHLSAEVSQYSSVAQALQAAQQVRQPQQGIVVFGSFYTVAAAMESGC